MARPNTVAYPENVELRIHLRGGSRQTHTLPEGKVYMVGSAAHHGLSIQADGVAPTHCMLALRKGLVHVRDWNSSTGTFLNGQRLDGESIAYPGDSIEIGSCRIEISAASTAKSSPSTMASHDTRPTPSRIETGVHGAVDMDSALDIMLQPVREQPVQKEILPEPAVEKPVARPNSTLSDTVVIECMDDWFAAIDAIHEPNEADGDELSILRNELAARDARIGELEAIVNSTTLFQPAESESGEATPQQSARLEQVLAELEQSDERIAMLTELLTRAEEVNRAATEERTQVENWIGEIERLFTARESEWQAERDVLNKRLAQVNEQCELLQRKIPSGKSSAAFVLPDMSTAAAQVQAKQVQQLKDELNIVRKSLEILTEDRDRLQSQIQRQGGADFQDQVRVQVEAQLREERLQLAQERADIAMLRTEMPSSLPGKAEESYQEQLPIPRGDDEKRAADYKIRAFREHLKELHATEPRPTNNRDTMSHRLGRLWRKLNGTPLDTD